MTRKVFRPRRDVDNRRSSRSESLAGGLPACDDSGRVEDEGLGETDGRGAALDPGAFLLPGFLRYDSPPDVPKARPAAAIPTVPTAQS